MNLEADGTLFAKRMEYRTTFTKLILVDCLVFIDESIVKL